MENKFLLFGGMYYDSAVGGWEDLQDRFFTIGDGIAYAHARPWWDWWHIVDSETLEIVMGEEETDEY